MTFMAKYPKINSVYKRDAQGRFTDEYSTPEIQYLASNLWSFTEKVDGTNIRIGWDPEEEKVHIGGRTDKSQIPPHLLEYLTCTFTNTKFQSVFPDTMVTLYGEGYGHKIQKVGPLYTCGKDKRVSFVLFDVRIGKWWLQTDSIKDIAVGLGIDWTPIIRYGTLLDAESYLKEFPYSLFGEDAPKEGLVLRPWHNLLDRSGRRIITKIKVKDFK